jgi:hypothetical protein
MFTRMGLVDGQLHRACVPTHMTISTQACTCGSATFSYFRSPVRPFVAATDHQVVASLEGLRSDGDLFHAACDAVCELVWCTVDHATGSIDPNMMPLIQVRYM